MRKVSPMRDGTLVILHKCMKELFSAVVISHISSVSFLQDLQVYLIFEQILENSTTVEGGHGLSNRRRGGGKSHFTIRSEFSKLAPDGVCVTDS